MQFKLYFFKFSRTWQSLKERYRKQLIHNVEKFKDVLSQEDIKSFQKWRAAKMKK